MPPVASPPRSSPSCQLEGDALNYEYNSLVEATGGERDCETVLGRPSYDRPISLCSLDMVNYYRMAIGFMFLRSEEYAICKDIFEDKTTVFHDAMARIPEASDSAIAELTKDTPGKIAPPYASTQRSMATVLAAIAEWHKIDNSQAVLFGCTDPNQDATRAKILLYTSACSAVHIYDFDLGMLTPSLRVELVAAHEVGHVIDMLTGDLGYDYGRCPACLENRATMYGTYLAQCRARTAQLWALQEFPWNFWIASGVDVPSMFKDEDIHVSRCWHTTWQRMERGLRRARCTWNSVYDVVPASFQKAFISPLAAAGALQSMRQCPTH